ncbi:acetyl-CoA acetyltransferase [Bailinhaonella thermotolerans]|uniref:Acetyl-CoA synthetase n=1 Tax=Bailinhaonella thermotolerans TaxID=1070861 RepID=A0A3A4ADS4_9ACTN|nr:acetyl-CoA acetyltransferase [Bailinhaonella thermotolerans]RJL26591.1 acetyl-CoA synthetase [Bailinhaonella thermotolerans]
MPIDPRTPVLVGVAQHTVRDRPGPEPLDLWERVAREAAEDAGAPGLLGRLGSVQVVYTESWQYDDPCGRLAERIGAPPGHRRYSTVSGTAPHVLIGDAAARIAAGELDAALVTGAEALATRRELRRAGEHARWSHAADPKPPYGWERPPAETELAHGLILPVHTYAMLDTARRARTGETLDRERADRGALMAGMTRVAAANPHAWFPHERTPEELVTPSPENRIVGWPYTKRTVAVMEVDMAAAVILVSAGLADALGIAEDRRVHLRGWAYAEDTWEVAARPVPGSSPAMRAAARAAFARSGVGPEDLTALDLYSCFAVAVRFACEATGLSPADPRGVTVTGGLPYAGGPGSAYVLHSTAAMAGRLRAAGGHGLVTGVGMHMTKHAYAVWSTEPGGSGEYSAEPVHRAEPVPIRDVYEGPAGVVAYTVAHGRDGAPEVGLLAVELPGGDRAYAHVRDADLIADAESRELVGQKVRLAPDGAVNVATW